MQTNHEAGTFDAVEPADHTRPHQAELAAIIAAEPGINTRGLIERAAEWGIGKGEVLAVLRGEDVRSWRTVSGPNRSKQYYPTAKTLAEHRKPSGTPEFAVCV